MGIGIVTWRIELDEPAKIHVGSTSFVTGNVVLRYTANHVGANELFGPMQVSILLHGRAKSKIWKRQGEHTHIYRGRAPLLSLLSGIHSGPAKVQSGQELRYPFSIYFPDKVQSDPSQPRWRAGSEYDIAKDAPLPPSMNLNYHGFGHRFDCFVEYRLRASISIPQIDVKIVPVYDDDGALVYFQPTRLSDLFQGRGNTIPLGLQQPVQIKNKYLLPEDKRPSGFMQHAKNFFDDDAYPKFLYTCALSGPAEVHLDRPITFTLSLRPDVQRSTCPELPVMKVISFIVQLKARTEVRADGTFSDRETRGNEALMSFWAKTTQLEDFSKANDFTKAYSTPVVTGIPSTFSTYNIFRTYTINVAVEVEAANKKTKFEREHRIKILPPLLQEDQMTIAGSSQHADGAHAGPSDAREPLPEYQAPPTYDEAKADS